MTDLWLTLVFKTSAVLAVAAGVAWGCRRSSAAVRHVTWLSGLIVLLTLPLGLLLPDEANPAWTARAFVSATPITGGSRAADLRPLTWLWAAGFGLMLIRLVGAGSRSFRLMRNAPVLSRTPEYEIRITSDAVGAAAWGFGTSVILLPAGAESWTSEQRRAVVEHEAAHLARKDCWALLIGELACAVYWFHPLVWYAASRMRMEQEHAADDAVLRNAFEPTEYAAGLLRIAVSTRTSPLLAGAGTRSMLAERVKAILDSERKRTMVNQKMLAAGIAAILLLGLPVAALQSERNTHKVGEAGVSAPKVISKSEPQYTPEAIEAKLQGPVVLSIVIEPDGKVSDAQVTKGLDPGLDKNAVESIKTWQFEPAQKDGKPVSVAARIQVNFRLK